MDFWFLVFLILFAGLDAAHVTARIRTELAEGAVRTGVLPQGLFVHSYIFTTFHLEEPFEDNLAVKSGVCVTLLFSCSCLLY